jgi:hypothetical protein
MTIVDWIWKADEQPTKDHSADREKKKGHEGAAQSMTRLTRTVTKNSRTNKVKGNLPILMGPLCLAISKLISSKVSIHSSGS